jgi:hypothetical protein
MNLNLRREARFHFGNCPSIFCCLIVLLDFVTVGSTKYFDRRDVFGVDGNLDVVCRREEAEVKGFQNIFLDVFLIDCTEVVEALDLFENLT